MSVESVVLKSFTILVSILSLSSCMTRKKNSGFEDIADFGLIDESAGVKVDDRAYFDDLKRSEASVSFDSSLPLPFRVGKSGDSFDSIPALAKPSAESRLSINIGPCTISLLSGPVQIDRYLLADKWIKLTEGLPAKTPVKLEPNQDLNIKAVTKLFVEVSETQNPNCRKMFEGRKFFIGRFHLHKSRLGLISGAGSPAISFGAKSLDPQGKAVFLHWQTGSNSPTVIDDFDFPATAESGIFRAQMQAKGYYYLAWQSLLRLDQNDSIVIKLPFNGPIPHSPPSSVSHPSPGKTPTVQTAPKVVPKANALPPIAQPQKNPAPVATKPMAAPARVAPPKPGSFKAKAAVGGRKSPIPPNAPLKSKKKPIPPKKK